MPVWRLDNGNTYKLQHFIVMVDQGEDRGVYNPGRPLTFHVGDERVRISQVGVQI